MTPDTHGMLHIAPVTLAAMRRAHDLIDRDYAEALDLDAMAREAGYSKYHFARTFAMAYGETPRAISRVVASSGPRTCCGPRT
jgi:AraC-like DNA-binding protein